MKRRLAVTCITAFAVICLIVFGAAVQAAGCVGPICTGPNDTITCYQVSGTGPPPPGMGPAGGTLTCNTLYEGVVYTCGQYWCYITSFPPQYGNYCYSGCTGS